MSTNRRVSNSFIKLQRLPIILLVFCASGFAAPPAQPPSLHHTVYSETAAELFWDHSSDDGMVVGYEVEKNGTVLGFFDAQSYFSNSLVKGSDYSFRVTAIDNDGERSTPATATFTGGDRSIATEAPNTPPVPSNLHFIVYSNTAAEIFWDRSTENDAVAGYEVILNGTVLGAFDAQSYFTDTLTKGAFYTFEVIAIAQDNTRSLPASVSFVGGDRSAAPDIPEAVLTLPAPTGLKANIYSSTAAELFWDLSSTAELSYEITRNGTYIGNHRGISYFDSSLSPASSYVYELIAIDQQNNRSEPATVIIITSDGVTPSSTPSSSTAPAIADPAGLYQSDGYGTIDVLRVDIKTDTAAGICTSDDQSGCTLADVMADIDGSDDLTVDIPIHFKAEDFSDDGTTANAELRQRGGFTRLAPQKSFRIKLDSKKQLWRDERRLQLNKMPYDKSRIRNKLAFDLMSRIPNLPSLRTQFVNLWIDDGEGPEDYGLFTHTEYVGGEYLEKRERNEDDNIYKIEEFVFSLSDLEFLALDEDGEPLDEDRFETRLEIKNGDDHHKLIEMIEAVNDNSRSFESILEQYFDEENILTWVTVNFLLHQTDAVTHNFYLYNPVESDKFYILPWDYDGTFNVETEPANSMETDELIKRLYYGYGKGRASNFINRYYRMPGVHQKVLAKAQELRNNQLMDSNIAQLANQYTRITSAYASQLPDVQFNASYYSGIADNFPDHVSKSHAALVNYGIPLPPRLSSPKFQDDKIAFRWEPAQDMNGNTITYDIEISTSPAFERQNRQFMSTGIAESSRTGFIIDKSRIGSGKRYARLIARVMTNPDRFWQSASNRPVIDGEMRVGVMEFECTSNASAETPSDCQVLAK